MKRKLRLELEREEQQRRCGNQLPPPDKLPTRAEHPLPSSPPTVDAHVGNNVEEVEDNQRRGQKVQLVFMMQGLGILVNCITLTILLMVFGQWKEYNNDSLLAVWRILYALGAAILVYVLIGRVLYLPESKVWKDDNERRVGRDYRQQLQNHKQRSWATPRTSSTNAVESGGGGFGGGVNQGDVANAPFPIINLSSSVSSLSAPSVALIDDDFEGIPANTSTTEEEDLNSSLIWLLLRNYGVRLLGASLAWLLWDVAFYGNKLFQSTFLLAICGEETTLVGVSFAATLNAFVAWTGYLCAAALIDHPSVGRLRLQQYGFLLTGSLFLTCGFLFDRLSTTWLVAMYIGSSFFGQCGPNATTFLLAAGKSHAIRSGNDQMQEEIQNHTAPLLSEIFPTEMRTMCHGIAAASGKLGALLAACAFPYLGDVDMFLWSGYASLAAAFVTFWTLPDVTRLDLYELDRQWRLIVEGRKREYKGDANKPAYWSYYERSKAGLPY